MTAPSGVVVLTDRLVARSGLDCVVAGAVAGGVRWVVLREKDLPRAERAALAADLRAILADVGGTLIVAGPDPLGGDAVHLPAAGPYPPPAHGLVGRSCHHQPELDRLTTEHYATISPVWPTKTKPGYGPPLDIAGLGSLVRASPIPLLALGGVETPEQVTACVQAGAVGVAVLGALMRAEDPTETAATLTSAFHEAVTPVLTQTRRGVTQVSTSGLRPTVPTQGSSLTARSGHGRPQPPTATKSEGK
ncbi:Thiamine phosphate synthase [Micromonospora saelicesensis]|uniref:Thiamine phosphate synthase n=1 Tax=Micromonospora saelicesensis TaxID=285676 RepID=A0A328NK19_9ACTN|nr:thiamine phosphate synthase [Micromonospora saelicesensis]RAO33057.1 Thiamine phosphate synthase [Micromonospora saelicesensis]